MSPPPGLILLVLPILSVLAGCTSPLGPKGVSPLRPAQMSLDSVALEIVSVRIPPGDGELGSRVWDEVDEQVLPPELRQRLAKSGFRAGLIGGQVPAVLAKLLELSDRPAAAGEPGQVAAADVQPVPRLAHRHLQTRAGQRNEIIASGIHERLPVLLCESGELRGQTYEQAQGILALVADPQPGGQVRLELTPELHHGQSRQQWVGNQAAWRLEAGRPKRVFDDLRVSALLSPGWMLLVGARSDSAGSLGHSFFLEGTDRDAHPEQKLILVRLCQTQHDDVVVGGGPGR